MQLKPDNFDYSLSDKVVLITGGARGIGMAISRLFAEKGAIVNIIDLLEEGQQVVKEINENGGKSHFYQADITDNLQLKEVVDNIIDQTGRIDILVNNAGVVYLDDAENLSEDDWDITMAVNLKAPFILSQLVGRQMIKQQAGKIINIASQAGIVALDNHIAYCTSKAGILSMTKVLALEWGQYNINVNAIAPTVVMTDLGEKAWAGEKGEKMKKKIPLQRFAQPEEIAGVALFLASQAADMITGEKIVIDGGYTIQ